MHRLAMMKQYLPTTTTLILLPALLVLLLAYLVYSASRQAGDLAAINARLDGLLDISARNSARITQLGKARQTLHLKPASMS